MTIQTVKSNKVEVPANATGGRTAELPFEHSDLVPGESVYVPGDEDAKKAVRRVLESARRKNTRDGEPKLDENGMQKTSNKGKPLFHKEHNATFKMGYIEDGKVYDKKFAGKHGWALWRVS